MVHKTQPGVAEMQDPIAKEGGSYVFLGREEGFGTSAVGLREG